MIKKVELRKFKKYKDKSLLLAPEGITLLAGGNNSGKSTLLHAIAVWEFCKLILKVEKGESYLFETTSGQGLGLSADEFLPIAIPSLKHLWTNLKPHKDDSDADGYNLKINCYWDLEEEKHLEVSLSLVNDRLFIKTTKSNVVEGDKIPTAAYLPTFAGILDKENKVSQAERRKLIGKGLAGSVLRNLILDLYNDNQKARQELKGDRERVSSTDLKKLRQSDPYEILLSNIRRLFATGLKVYEFNDLYHTAIKIQSFKGEFNSQNKFIKYTSFNPRDLMVEGSGFLQWLNVFALSLNPEIDILLLDEPDAHLHCSLQQNLISELGSIVEQKQKQVIIATHSSEIIKSIDHRSILNINRSSSYLNSEGEKSGLLAGIGAAYSPKLERLNLTKKVLFIEGELDLKVLTKVGELIGSSLPSDIVPWITAIGHKERKYLFKELKKEISELSAVSLRDRDDEPINSVGDNLEDKSHDQSELTLLKWKRRNLESYLIIPEIIANLSNSSVQEIKDHLANNFALALPNNYLDSSVPDALLNIDGKDLLDENLNSIKNKFQVDRYDIVNNLELEFISEDLKTCINEIIKVL